MPLLSTKLQIPRLRPERISRARLWERLQAGLARPLTLVSAPAGFGKTTLVAEWLATCRRPFAWLTLDEQDNDPTRFLTYLTAALRQIEDEAGQATLATFAFSGPQVSLSALMPQLVNEIGAIPEEFVLVLDDYHLITSQPIHEAVAFLVDHPPACMHLLLATRADPPLSLARLRARGQINELRQADLQFTPAEAAELLRQSVGAGLTPGQIDLLAERTEGWVAGLQLAALALVQLTSESGHASREAEEFIRAFSGTQRHVLDYLAEEVLQRQPPQVQSFLLRTSILERLCGPLCEAVTQEREELTGRRTDASAHPMAVSDRPLSGQQMLEQLERANLFVSALDDRREWYRYHRLFADLLRQRLHEVAGSDHAAGQRVDIAALHRRAAEWHERSDALPEAIHHSLAAGDCERAADLIERAVAAAWKQGELATLLGWIEALPDVVLGAHPLLCIYAAMVTLIRTSSLADVEQLVRMAADNDPQGRLRGEAAVLRALIASYEGDVTRGLALAEQAMRLLPETSILRGLATRAMSALHLMAGDTAVAERLLEEDLATCERSGDRLGASACMRRLGSLALYRGELRRARSLYERALDLSRDMHGRLWPVAGRVLVHLAELALERNDLKEAEDCLSEAQELFGVFMPGWNASGSMVLAHLRQAQGDEAAARQALEVARELARTTETRMDDVYLEVQAARLALLQRDFSSAERWASQWVTGPMPGARRERQDIETLLRSRIFHEMGQRTLVRLYLARGQVGQALTILETLPGVSTDESTSGRDVELLVLHALAHEAQGQGEAALSDLGNALTLAEPEGFVRTFLDEGEPMARILRKAVKSGLSPDYAARLLAALERGARQTTGVREASPAKPWDAPSLAEPLTEREVEVLRLLQTSLTTPEIADHMGIAPSTVRTFVKHLYGKLGVHRRLDALTRARELGLLQA